VKGVTSEVLDVKSNAKRSRCIYTFRRAAMLSQISQSNYLQETGRFVRVYYNTKSEGSRIRCCSVAPNSQVCKKITLQSRGYSSWFVDRGHGFRCQLEDHLTDFSWSSMYRRPFVVPFQTLASNMFVHHVADPVWFTSTAL
jgi:hypothetical protein